MLRTNTIYFAYQDGRTYARRVADLVDEMMSAHPCPDYGKIQARPGKTYETEVAVERIRNLDPVAAVKKYVGRLMK